MRMIRLFSILDRLRIVQQPISAKRLANELDVSMRTIYRDMVTLQTMGAPIRGEGGVGYQIEKGYFLPPLHFDAYELDAVVLGMRLVAARGDGPLADAALRASAKINTVLSETDQDRHARSPLLACSVQDETLGNSISFLSPLRVALRERNKLQISYSDLEGRVSNRTVRPLGLTAFDQVWLLTAWCERRNDFRNFRVDRVKSVKQTGDNFARESGKEFRDYLRTL